MLFRSSFSGTFSLYTGVARRDPTMLFPKSSCVRIPCFKSVTPRVCMDKYHIGLFGGPDENRNECCHIHVLKTFPRLY